MLGLRQTRASPVLPGQTAFPCSSHLVSCPALSACTPPATHLLLGTHVVDWSLRNDATTPGTYSPISQCVATTLNIDPNKETLSNMLIGGKGARAAAQGSALLCVQEALRPGWLAGPVVSPGPNPAYPLLLQAAAL